MNDSVVEATDFRETCGDLVAVNGISFEVKCREIFGLFGSNGVGKTSTPEVLEGLCAPGGSI